MRAPAGEKILRDVFLGFMRVHVLHHAAREPVFGLEMIVELRRHGYHVGPGTMYPLLHALEAAALLRSNAVSVSGKKRRYYRTTRAGDALLRELRAKVAELTAEVLEPHKKKAPKRPGPVAKRSAAKAMRA